MKTVARMAIIVAVLASGPAAEAAKNNYGALACNNWFRSVDRNGDGSLG